MDEAGMVLFGMGAVLVGISGYFIYADYSKLKGWVKAEGKVSASEMVFYNVRNRSTTRTGYRPKLEYDYSYGGTEYHGSVIEFTEHKSYLDSHPVGSTVGIIVNPANPGQSLVEEMVKPFRISKLFVAVLGIVLMLLAL